MPSRKQTKRTAPSPQPPAPVVIGPGSAANIYPRLADAELDMALFRAPTAEYRGTPFWAWNCKLKVPALLRQLEQFKAMGLGGGHMHARVGLATDYLGDDFMKCVKACVEKCKAERMLAWLYDEDRWPSGAAGGLVTRDPQYRARHLRFTPREDTGADAAERRRELLARYVVELKNGRLARYRRLKDGETPKAGTLWYAYLESLAPRAWFNNQTYLDTMSRPAVEKFIAATHERYKEVVGADFGTVVPAIFTDEPNIPGQGCFAHAAETRDITCAWTDDFVETYRVVYGEDPLDSLPEVFWELSGGRKSRARYRYHDHRSERFASAFCDTIGAWCEHNKIAFTGHLLSEETLRSQMTVLGEAMRGYRGFQLPGIDMLCDRLEFSTAKQAQSAARQYGRPGVLSELYGVTNWDFDFAGHKRQGDWQAALGITVRVQHLAWASMEGEAKRDYPAAIGYQSPWYLEYPLVEDHFARVNVALTRGRPVTRVAVIQPIESYWLCTGPLDQTRLEREQREEAFDDIIHWLLHGLIDFDFICESNLPALCPKPGGRKFRVGACAYDVVVVPGLKTIRSTTLARLEAFAMSGGTVLFAGEVPDHVDAVPSERAARLAKRCRRVPFHRPGLLQALEPWREVGVQSAEGGPVESLIYQLREDGKRRRLFICNTSRDAARMGCQVSLRGLWKLTEMDTGDGSVRPLPAAHRDGRTVFTHDFQACGHLLLQLDPAQKTGRAGLAAPPATVWRETAQLAGPVPVTLAEPNVLLLDQAEWRLDQGAWQPVEEVLRINNAARKQLGWPPTGGGMAQPWVEPADPPKNSVGLRFKIESRVAVGDAKLALENAAACMVRLDGQDIPTRPDGWWVDEDIHTVPLPPLAAGSHVLEITVPYGRRTSLEWCYLLGSFGVEVRGRRAWLTEPVRELDFGDWTRQGLPFYAGNVTYHLTWQAPGSAALCALRVPLFRSPVLKLVLDGSKPLHIAYPPFQVELGELKPGPHKLDLTAFGCRINAFGALHNIDPNVKWWGPGAWRSEGSGWSYEYVLRPQGILSAPRIMALCFPLPVGEGRVRGRAAKGMLSLTRR